MSSPPPITSSPLWFDPFPSAQSDLLSPTSAPSLLSSFLFPPIFLPSFGFYPPFSLPLSWSGRAGAGVCFIPRCFRGGFVSFPSSSPSPTTWGFLGFFFFFSLLPSHPFLWVFLHLILIIFFGVLHAEVCMTHVVEGERKVQSSVCVACLMRCALTL